MKLINVKLKLPNSKLSMILTLAGSLVVSKAVSGVTSAAERAFGVVAQLRTAAVLHSTLVDV